MSAWVHGKKPEQHFKSSTRKEKGEKKGGGGQGGKVIANSKYGWYKTPKAFTLKASALSTEKKNHIYIYLLSFYRQIAFIQIRFILFQIKGIRKDLESLKELRSNRDYSEFFSNLETHTHQHSQSQFANVRISISSALAQMPFKSYW